MTKVNFYLLLNFMCKFILEKVSLASRNHLLTTLFFDKQNVRPGQGPKLMIRL